MLASVVSAAVAVVVMVTIEVGGRTIDSTTVTAPVPCPFLFEEKDGGCVHRWEMEEAIAAARQKRQAVINTQCPRCVAGIYDVYPNWDDCTKLNYCYDGHVVPIDCAHFNATFFNPVTKACETSAQPNNTCIYRSSTVLLQ